jgi:hypothetical protein
MLASHKTRPLRIGARVAVLCSSVALVSVGAAQTAAQQLTPTWVQVGDGGTAIAKVIVPAGGACPSINLDGTNLPMARRRPIPEGFPPLCEAVIPGAAKSASVNGQPLALPKPNPTIVTVFGDTGCRIKGAEVQGCGDPEKWPFAQVAADVAAEKPDLTIHVGDYLYREIPCPPGSESLCSNSPSGDNWETWNADFFIPAAKLLVAAPWAFARGNHENCARSWRGWFYYFDPRPWNGECVPYSPPYVVKLGSFELAMIDSSEVVEDTLDEKQISNYTAQLTSLHTTNAWLVTHHPFWGFKAGALGKPSSLISAPLEEAWDRAAPTGISLILSGHIHLFELVVLDKTRPPQIVAGGGGTNLAAPITKASLNGSPVRTSVVVEGESQHLFGYTVLNKRGTTWHLTLKNQAQDEIFGCTFGQPSSVQVPSRATQGSERICGAP